MPKSKEKLIPKKTIIRRALHMLSGFAALLLFETTAVHAGVVAISTSYTAQGSAADAVVSQQNDVLASVSPQPNSPIATPWIRVFRPSLAYGNPCPAKNPFIRFTTPQIKQIQGLQVFPDESLQLGRQSIGAAVEAQGVNFFRALDLNTCVIDSEKNVQQTPSSQNFPDSPGSFILAVTPAPSAQSGQEFAFVANEYGAPPATAPSTQRGGTVGIIKVERDSYGRFTNGTALIPTNPYIYIPGANTIPSVTMSHNGRYLYVVNEGADEETLCPTKFSIGQCSNPTKISFAPGQVSSECRNEFGWYNNITTPNGVLSIIDVQKAGMGQGQKAIIITVAAGCSPVRVVESLDGTTIWVAARGGDPKNPVAGSILEFSVSKLLSNNWNDVNAALTRIWPSGGTQPVGLALFGNGKYLAVANSNRYTLGETGQTNVAIIDITNPSTPPLVCNSKNLFDFPRGIAVGNDDSTLYVANYGCEPRAKSDTNPLITCVRPPATSTIVSGSLQVITTAAATSSICR